MSTSKLVFGDFSLDYIAILPPTADRMKRRLLLRLDPFPSHRKTTSMDTIPVITNIPLGLFINGSGLTNGFEI